MNVRNAKKVRPESDVKEVLLFHVELQLDS